MSELLDLKSLGLADLERLVERMGYPSFRGRQLFEWLFRHGARSLVQMHTLPADLRARLAVETRIRQLVEVDRQTSSDGTIKFLFRIDSGEKLESVLIPDFDADGTPQRVTVCVSSQVGCAMGCVFCATGQMGFRQNLTAGEIYDQVHSLNMVSNEIFGRDVTNVVFMGMGEPLLNYDELIRSIQLMSNPRLLHLAQRRITISTVGLAGQIRKLADEELRTNLAVSLHAPTDAQRSSIMPVNRKRRTDLAAVRDAVVYYTQSTGRIVTYEYCMFAGFNDSLEDAKNLVSVCRWAPCKVNLIMYNPVPGSGFSRTEEADLERFIRVLVDGKVRVTVRRSRGQDIAAACGQLATTASGQSLSI